MDDYRASIVQTGVNMFATGVIALIVIFAAAFYFLSIGDAFLTLGGIFAALWISVGEGANILYEDIFANRGNEAEIAQMRRNLWSRYALSIIILVATVLLVLFA